MRTLNISVRLRSGDVEEYHIQPRVNPEVGNAIDAHHLTESTVVGPGAEDTEPKSDTNVGNDNLPGMVRCVERSLGDKV